MSTSKHALLWEQSFLTNPTTVLLNTHCRRKTLPQSSKTNRSTVPMVCRQVRPLERQIWLDHTGFFWCTPTLIKIRNSRVNPKTTEWGWQRSPFAGDHRSEKFISLEKRENSMLGILSRSCAVTYISDQHYQLWNYCSWIMLKIDFLNAAECFIMQFISLQITWRSSQTRSHSGWNL